MWNIKEVKQAGREAFRRNRGKCIFVGFFLSLAQCNWYYPRIPQAPLYEMFAVVLITILILNAVKIGCVRFFLTNTEKPASFSEMKIAVSRNLLNIMMTTVISEAIVFLWCLLLVIPGIVKSYSYRMVPYVLADSPNMDWRDILRESENLMYGHRWQMFLFDLSFLGWTLLGTITCGIGNLIWTAPYFSCAEAEIYRKLDQNPMWEMGEEG
ncbi:MAG: DUF975 family protein [Clostridiales bacterium]|nr:DUF975 family protein [Clostridiales bacterium]